MEDLFYNGLFRYGQEDGNTHTMSYSIKVTKDPSRMRKYGLNGGKILRMIIRKDDRTVAWYDNHKWMKHLPVFTDRNSRYFADMLIRMYNEGGKDG